MADARLAALVALPSMRGWFLFLLWSAPAATRGASVLGVVAGLVYDPEPWP